MLLEESHGHLGWCLCEGIYAWGAKSETCWVSSVFHSISQPEALAEPEGTKNYVWHFPSSLPFLCPLKSCCHYTDKSECTNIYTHTCASLWLEMSTVPPLLVFIPELLPPVYVSFLALVSLQTPSDLRSKCPACVFASITPELLHKCIYQLSYSALSWNCFHKWAICAEASASSSAWLYNSEVSVSHWNQPLY